MTNPWRPMNLRNTLTATEVQHHLFVHNSLLSNTTIDTTLKLVRDGKNRILDYSVEIGNPKISNESLADTITKNFQSEFIARVYKKEYWHQGLLLITNRSTAQEIVKLNNRQFSGKVLALQEKNEWYQLGGRNKLEYLLQKCELSKADRAKIASFIRAEGCQYLALVSMAHIIPWLISRLNNNNALQRQLNKLPMWY